MPTSSELTSSYDIELLEPPLGVNCILGEIILPLIDPHINQMDRIITNYHDIYVSG